MEHLFIEDNEQTENRRARLEQIRVLIGNPYPSDFQSERSVTSLTTGFGHYTVADAEYFISHPATVITAGRLATPLRLMGKMAFVHISDGLNQIQLMFRKNEFVAEGERTVEGWDLLNLLDAGDFVGVKGEICFTKSGELTVRVKSLTFLAKALNPMPDKVSGIQDPEIKYRQPYLNMLGESLRIKELRGLTPREIFEQRSQTLAVIRNVLRDERFTEVETPVLTPLASGAAAQPFVTHHNALDVPLYARIAPELYLKRLLVGGFERVYEIGKNFRNEGISTRHNPEFTMLEAYVAYTDWNWMMQFTERLIKTVFYQKTGEFQHDKFKRTTIREAREEFGDEWESHLIEPTFVTGFGVAESPLSKVTADEEGNVTVERFELYMDGMEIANGFSELNDPIKQHKAFLYQAKLREGGDQEAMQTDYDYLRALTYGMPPASGVGIGIDRLLMSLLGVKSIRDVITFPVVRQKQ